MEKINIEDIIRYCKNNNVSKEDALFILNLYNTNKFKEDIDEEICLKDITSSLNKLNNSLMKADNTEIVTSMIKKEIKIINKISEDIMLSTTETFKMYYEIAKMLYKQDQACDKSGKILNKMLEKNEKRSKTCSK